MIDTSEWIKLLAQKLPGEEAHLRMSPAFRGEQNEQKEAADAAVLVLLYPSNGNIHLAFIKRNEYDGPHSAQVSFPGGAYESGDKNLEKTALRETREELGVGGKIEILGALTPLHIPLSNFMVYPFVGWTNETPRFLPDPSEVQYVIEVSLKKLLDPLNTGSESLYHNGQAINIPFYRVEKEKIWGATAMMLSEFLQLASRLQ